MGNRKKGNGINEGPWGDLCLCRSLFFDFCSGVVRSQIILQASFIFISTSFFVWVGMMRAVKPLECESGFVGRDMEAVAS